MTDPEQPRRADPIVTRVNDLVTTFMDLLGGLLIAAGGAWATWQKFGFGWGLAVGGITVLVMSTWAQMRAQPARPKPAARPHREPLPGPSDAGSLHIAGGR